MQREETLFIVRRAANGFIIEEQVDDPGAVEIGEQPVRYNRERVAITGEEIQGFLWDWAELVTRSWDSPIRRKPKAISEPITHTSMDNVGAMKTE